MQKESQKACRNAPLQRRKLGTAGALIGVFIVQRGLGLLSDGLAHATFGGIALRLLFGPTPDRASWGALPFTVAVALGIQQLRRRASLGGDVATGVFFAVAPSPRACCSWACAGPAGAR